MSQINPGRAMTALLIWVALVYGSTLKVPSFVSRPPIDVEGTTFLITYPADAKVQFSPENRKYQNLLNDTEVIAKLEAVTKLEPNGKNHFYRIVESNRDLSKEAKVWQDIQARPKTQDYWFYGSNKTRWTEGPLPPVKTDLLNLIDEYKE